MDRFWSKVDKTSNDCWQWLGCTAYRGYGKFYLNGVKIQAHRVAYEMCVGPIPEGMVIDHLCRNRACVNPAHLEPVTHGDNVRRGIVGEVNRARMLAMTHCSNGHEYTEENTRQTARQRVCRTCAREWMRASRAQGRTK